MTLPVTRFVPFPGQYLNLDKDHNGMLSKQELARFGTGTLTNVFLDRVFQECLTYDGEMVSRVDLSGNVFVLCCLHTSMETQRK